MDYTILVNKQYRLPSAFFPDSLTAPKILFDAAKDEPKRYLETRTAHFAELLFTAAKHAGLDLYGISGYRPYARQQELYENAADQNYVAPPGASEHQTGLALDVSCPAIGLDLIPAFADTKEGIWLRKNASLYGFILRYPKRKEKITGYAYEPWHIRYVTKPFAIYLTLTGLTLEEYYEDALTVPSDVP